MRDKQQQNLQSNTEIEIPALASLLLYLVNSIRSGTSYQIVLLADGLGMVQRGSFDNMCYVKRTLTFAIL